MTLGAPHVHEMFYAANQLTARFAAVAQIADQSRVAHGGAAWDHSGMVRALEKLANHEIGGK